MQYQTDYQIEEISLSSATIGSPVDMKPYLVELSVFEDIFNNSVSGHLMVSDALGLIPNFKLNGTETIKVKFKKDAKESRGVDRSFRVYKISDRYFNPTNGYENYKINFCSEELLLSEKYRVSKSYKKEYVSNIVNDVLNNLSKIGSKKKVYIEETTGTYDFTLPNKKIFETVNWLTTYALPKSKTGADMLFFENVDGYWFKSLQSLYDQKPLTTYYYNPKNISQEMEQKFKNIMELDILDSFDVLRSISGGTFANRLITIDPLTRTKTTTDFDYNKYFSKSTTMNKASVTNNYKDTLGKTLFDSPPGNLESGSFRLMVSNSKHKDNPYLKSKPGSVKSNFFIEDSIPNRAAQLTLSNYSRVKITIPGNAQLSVGMTLQVSVPKMGATTYTKVNNPVKRTEDPILSGKYLITAVRHVISPMTYISVVELCKESFIEPVPSA